MFMVNVIGLRRVGEKNNSKIFNLFEKCVFGEYMDICNDYVSCIIW